MPSNPADAPRLRLRRALLSVSDKSGLIDFATVLETQRTQLSAQDSVATTVASVAADHVRLYKALGGGWQ